MTDLLSETITATERTAYVSNEATLSFAGVTFRFGDVVAVDDVSFSVTPGRIVGLLGHNGAGKTTIVRLLAGLLTPQDGTVRVLGQDPAADGGKARERLGVLPSSQLVDGRLTATENLLFAGSLWGLDPMAARERSDRLLSMFGLSDRTDDLVAGFSTGMRQRVALARVLLPRPDVLLLDEPSAAMDPVGAQEFRDLVKEQATSEGRTVLLCTHDLVEAEQLCDEVIILAQGRILVSGAPRELTAQLQGATGVSFETHPGDATTVRSVLREHRMEVPVDRGAFALPGATRDDIAALVAALAEADVRVYAVEPSRPALSDLYFSLHEQPTQDTEEESSP